MNPVYINKSENTVTVDIALNSKLVTVLVAPYPLSTWDYSNINRIVTLALENGFDAIEYNSQFYFDTNKNSRSLMMNIANKLHSMSILYSKKAQILWDNIPKQDNVRVVWDQSSVQD